MEKLNKIKRKFITLEDMNKYPIWTWDEGMDDLEPVYEPEPSIKNYNDLFIKAVFTTNNYLFNGYLMGGETFYGFALFLNNEEIGFNFNLPNLIEKNCEKIFHLLNCEPFPFFPTTYSSDVHLKEKKNISGVFNFSKQKP